MALVKSLNASAISQLDELQIDVVSNADYSTIIDLLKFTNPCTTWKNCFIEVSMPEYDGATNTVSRKLNLGRILSYISDLLSTLANQSAGDYVDKTYLHDNYVPLSGTVETDNPITGTLHFSMTGSDDQLIVGGNTVIATTKVDSTTIEGTNGKFKNGELVVENGNLTVMGGQTTVDALAADSIEAVNITATTKYSGPLAEVDSVKTKALETTDSASLNGSTTMHDTVLVDDDAQMTVDGDIAVNGAVLLAGVDGKIVAGSNKETDPCIKSLVEDSEKRFYIDKLTVGKSESIDDNYKALNVKGHLKCINGQIKGTLVNVETVIAHTHKVKVNATDTADVVSGMEFTGATGTSGLPIGFQQTSGIALLTAKAACWA